MKTFLLFPFAATLAVGTVTFSAFADDDTTPRRPFTPTIGVNPSAGDVSVPVPNSGTNAGSAADDDTSGTTANDVNNSSTITSGQSVDANGNAQPGGAPSDNGNPANITTEGSAGAPSMNGRPASSGTNPSSGNPGSAEADSSGTATGTDQSGTSSGQGTSGSGTSPGTGASGASGGANTGGANTGGTNGGASGGGSSSGGGQ